MTESIGGRCTEPPFDLLLPVQGLGYPPITSPPQIAPAAGPAAAGSTIEIAAGGHLSPSHAAVPGKIYKPELIASCSTK